MLRLVFLFFYIIVSSVFALLRSFTSGLFFCRFFHRLAVDSCPASEVSACEIELSVGKKSIKAREVEDIDMDFVVASKAKEKEAKAFASASEYALDEISHKKGKAVDDSDAGGGLTSLFSLVDAAHVTKGTESALGVINSGAAKAVKALSRGVKAARCVLLTKRKVRCVGAKCRQTPIRLHFPKSSSPSPQTRPNRASAHRQFPACSFIFNASATCCAAVVPAASAPTFPTSPRLTKMIGVYDPAWRKIRLEGGVKSDRSLF